MKLLQIFCSSIFFAFVLQCFPSPAGSLNVSCAPFCWYGGGRRVSRRTRSSPSFRSPPHPIAAVQACSPKACLLPVCGSVWHTNHFCYQFKRTAGARYIKSGLLTRIPRPAHTMYTGAWFVLCLRDPAVLTSSRFGTSVCSPPMLIRPTNKGQVKDLVAVLSKKNPHKLQGWSGNQLSLIHCFN